MAATKKAKTKQGGARNVGKKKANNKSGLAGIFYSSRMTKSKHPVMRVYVRPSFSDSKKGTAGRGTISVKAHGPEGALNKAIGQRMSAGLPPPSEADWINGLKNLKAYMEAVNHQDGKGPKDDDDDT